MGGREFGYYGPSDADVGFGCISVLVIVLGIPLALALLVLSFQGEPVGCTATQSASEFSNPVNDTPINAGDERAMHAVGLPTKADVLEWHETGRWGYGRYEDGEYVVRTFTELPDGAELWDGIYGLDNADPAFRFR